MNKLEYDCQKPQVKIGSMEAQHHEKFNLRDAIESFLAKKDSAKFDELDGYDYIDKQIEHEQCASINSTHMEIDKRYSLEHLKREIAERYLLLDSYTEYTKNKVKKKNIKKY